MNVGMVGLGRDGHAHVRAPARSRPRRDVPRPPRRGRRARGRTGRDCRRRFRRPRRRHHLRLQRRPGPRGRTRGPRHDAAGFHAGQPHDRQPDHRRRCSPGKPSRVACGCSTPRSAAVPTTSGRAGSRCSSAATRPCSTTSAPRSPAYSDPILHVGRLGDGQRVKLVNNALFGAQVALVAEAEHVAEGLGVDPATALDAIQHCSGDSRVLRTVVAVGSSAGLARARRPFHPEGCRRGRAGRTGGWGSVSAASARRSYRLADIEAIKQLKARYFRFIDTKDWAAFRDLFTEDCKHYLPQESAVPFMTNEDYFAMNERLLTPGVTTHHGHMPEITFLSDTEAEGIWAMFDYVQIEPPSGRVSIMGYGHYYRDLPQVRRRRVAHQLEAQRTASPRPGALDAPGLTHGPTRHAVNAEGTTNLRHTRLLYRLL